MNILIIEPRTKSDARLLKNFSKRLGAKVFDADENFETIVTRRLFEEELVDTAEEATIAVAKVKDFARSRGLSLNVIGVDELLEEYEDFVFGQKLVQLDKDAELASIEELDATFDRLLGRK